MPIAIVIGDNVFYKKRLANSADLFSLSLYSMT